MLRNMLDTNLCIRLLRDRPQSLRARFNTEADTLCVSAIILAEPLHSAAKSAKPVANRQAVENFAARLQVLSFDENAASHAGDIYADLERRGQVIGPYDILIAGHARSRGLVVITGNLKAFQRVDGLRAEDWLA